MNATTTARPAAPAPGEKPVPNQRTLIGRVTSTKMQKTLVVRIERRVRDPMMGKTITRSRKNFASSSPSAAGSLSTSSRCACAPRSEK